MSNATFDSTLTWIKANGFTSTDCPEKNRVHINQTRHRTKHDIGSSFHEGLQERIMYRELCCKYSMLVLTHGNYFPTQLNWRTSNHVTRFDLFKYIYISVTPSGSDLEYPTTISWHWTLVPVVPRSCCNHWREKCILRLNERKASKSIVTAVLELRRQITIINN